MNEKLKELESKLRKQEHESEMMISQIGKDPCGKIRSLEVDLKSSEEQRKKIEDELAKAQSDLSSTQLELKDEQAKLKKEVRYGSFISSGFILLVTSKFYNKQSVLVTKILHLFPRLVEEL